MGFSLMQGGNARNQAPFVLDSPSVNNQNRGFQVVNSYLLFVTIRREGPQKSS